MRLADCRTHLSLARYRASESSVSVLGPNDDSVAAHYPMFDFRTDGDVDRADLGEIQTRFDGPKC